MTAPEPTVERAETVGVLDLDRVERRLRHIPVTGDWLSVPALVAEVRRLRAEVVRLVSIAEGDDILPDAGKRRPYLGDDNNEHVR